MSESSDDGSLIVGRRQAPKRARRKKDPQSESHTIVIPTIAHSSRRNSIKIPSNYLPIHFGLTFCRVCRQVSVFLPTPTDLSGENWISPE